MATLKPAVDSKDHSQGGDSASITIVEFGDYQCPHCGAAYPVIKEIQEAFGDQIKFIFRNFPLAEIHPFAKIAAQATEAANVQGKYWKMHDAIFERQSHLSTNFITKLAEELGLDVEQFLTDLNSEEVITKVEDDFESGIRSGVNGTPSFFVNGEKFDGGVTDLFEVLKEST